MRIVSGDDAIMKYVCGCQCAYLQACDIFHAGASRERFVHANLPEKA